MDTGSIFGTATSMAVPYPPNIRVGDRALMLIATANEPVAAPTGWTERTRNGSGTAGAVGSVGGQLFEKDTPYAKGDAVPTVVAAGNHVVFRMFSVRQAKLSGTCIAQVATAIDTTGGTALTFPAVTTTTPGDLILNFMTDELDAATARLSGEANAGLIGLTERIDGGNVTGNGSGIGLYSGLLSTAGTSGATTATHTQTTAKALFTLAVKPDLAAA